MKRFIAFFFAVFATVAVANNAVQEKFGEWYMVGVNEGIDKEIWAVNGLPGSKGDVLMIISSAVTSCDSWQLYFSIKMDEKRDTKYTIENYGSMDLVVDGKLAATTGMMLNKKAGSSYIDIYLNLGDLGHDESATLWKAIKAGKELKIFWVNGSKEAGTMTYDIRQADTALDMVTLRCQALAGVYL